MRMILVFGAMVAIGLGVLAVNSPSIEGSRPCRQCPDVPIPSDCPACYEWVPQTCRECGHCERIKGCAA